MRTERMEFIEAAEKLAKELGLELPKSNFQRSEEPQQDQKVLNDIYGANDAALKWFRANLLENRNLLASAYLPKREISPELSEKFLLGAAIDEWEALKAHLLKLGFSESLLVQAGLCVRSERGSVYDRFRNRLIFPIHDINGKVCGFGGRQLDDDPKSPKYLNSAETDVYKKSKMLYALNLARKPIEDTGYAFLCEGYMDVIIAHAYGYNQAVASLGTAFTDQQARLLKRFASKTYFLYDGDDAGQKAMLRGGESLLQAGFDTRTITLPPEDDPDSFLRREGADALKPLMEDADEFFDYALHAHSQSLDIQTLAGQAELVERMAPVILSIRNEIMREGGIQRLLSRLGGLPREALQQILNKKQTQITRRESYGDREPSPDGMSGGAPTLDPMEKSLLKVLLESHAALEYIRLNLQYDWVRDERLADWIFFFFDHSGFVETILNELEVSGKLPGSREILTSVLAWDYPLGNEPDVAAHQLLRRLHERHQRYLVDQLAKMIDDDKLDDEDASRLLGAIHHENRMRLEHSGRFLRTRDSQSRNGQATTKPTT